MGVESATYVGDLVPTNPPSSDLVAQGATHINLIKSVLQNSFPSLERAILFKKFATKTANYSILSGDDETIFLVDTTSGNLTFTLPAVPAGPWKVTILKTSNDANTISIVGTVQGGTLAALVTQNDTYTIGGNGSSFVLLDFHLSSLITYAGIQQVGASKLLGNPTGSAASVSEITLGGGLAFSGTVLSLSILPEPQGYLTPSSGIPIIASDVLGATSIFYTPYKGNLIPIYNGTIFVLTPFTELTLGLVSNHLSSSLYDGFVINDAGTIRLVTGPAWNTITAGSCDRGTGGGTTELQRVNGVWTNKNSMTARYGATTVTVAANQGTFVGTLYIDGTAGQLTCHRSYGQSRKWGISNAYNRDPIILQMGDPTASWALVPTSWRESRGQTTNFMTLLSCLPEEMYALDFKQNVSVSGSNSSFSANIGIGVNSTTTPSGLNGVWVVAHGATSFSDESGLHASLVQGPTLGINTYNSLEQGPANGGAFTFNGAVANMLMTGTLRG